MNKQKITNLSQNVNPNLDKINFLRVAHCTRFVKARRTRQIIRFKGDDTAAYRAVREDVGDPQNLY